MVFLLVNPSANQNILLLLLRFSFRFDLFVSRNIYIPENSIINDFSLIEEFKNDEKKAKEIESRIINVGEYNIN